MKNVWLSNNRSHAVNAAAWICMIGASAGALNQNPR